MSNLSVDVVTVAYKSRAQLRSCVEPLLGAPGVSVVVVDNACPERSFEVVAGLPGVRVVHLPRNGGFAFGCNAGWREGAASYVLFLNPDARLELRDLERLVDDLECDPRAGVIGPRTINGDGRLSFTIRRFPSLISTWAQALFLHRLLPRARWVDEVDRDPASYERRSRVDWLSGSCLLVRRDVLEAIDGWDESFFLYSEDVDFCRRVERTTGLSVVYSPAATCVHVGGGSGAREHLLPMLAASRLRYARRHRGRLDAALERVGIGVGEALRTIVGRGGRRYRRGHFEALRVIVRGDDSYRPNWAMRPSGQGS